MNIWVHIAKSVIFLWFVSRICSIKIEGKLYVQNYLYFLSHLDRCSPNGDNICKNGGICTLNGDNSIKCLCPSTHDGIYCENGEKYDSNYLFRFHIKNTQVKRNEVKILSFQTGARQEFVKMGGHVRLEKTDYLIVSVQQDLKAHSANSVSQKEYS